MQGDFSRLHTAIVSFLWIIWNQSGAASHTFVHCSPHGHGQWALSQQNKQDILKDNFLPIFIDSDSDTKTSSQKLNGSNGFSI